MKKSTIVVFIVTYGLFTLSGFLFPVDQDWYQALNKPVWTPSGMFIGVVWAVLYFFISLSVAIVFNRAGFGRQNSDYLSLLSLNYLLNQAFSFFQFQMKNLFLSFLDAFLLTVTTLALTFLSNKYSKFSSWLLVPYLLWGAFATFLAWKIYTLN
ncbi:TspO/MBR family protein [Pseudalkalibacillus caeni]|uniref:Tryptophan-rich sensory protein n=1 Tax=Exobacillus caeni TaxID=2574798 RepID=A0A5R9FEJ0_9BACL|nr:tryptophan-rich sensory protein [Pseudalkalibacillus caeni]TLS37985.1 tryptophan-rich sensory protein [Pseudalkalibacillus caeni]